MPSSHVQTFAPSCFSARTRSITFNTLKLHLAISITLVVAALATMDADTIEIPNTTVFRPSKRRKFNRAPRQSSDDEHSDKQRPDGSSPAGIPENGTASHSSEVTRLHRPKPRKNGIVFSNALPRNDDPSSSETTVLAPRADQLQSMSTRFVAHSDQVVDVDKHMCVCPLTPHTLR